MAHRLIENMKSKLGGWFMNPIGGRGGKKETPHRIDEFYPRGSAGRRESRGPSGSRKAVMPHQGSRPKYPK